MPSRKSFFSAFPGFSAHARLAWALTTYQRMCACACVCVCVPTQGASYVMFWETYDNECTGGVGCSGGRCHDAAHPVDDPKRLHGFWLTRPDGSHSWPYSFLKRTIAEGGAP